MKKDIHPQWYPQAKVICSCGNTFTTGSTVPKIQVEICSACHPFFTGQMKYVDTAGRVERFQQKQAVSVGFKKVTRREKRLLRKLTEEEEEKKRPKSFKELLGKKE